MALYNKFFYNEVIRKYVIVFGHLFSDIQVIRKDASGKEIRRELVPLTYAPKEKFVARLEQDYSEDRRVAIKLPHMAFEITGYSYAPERKLSSFRKMIERNDDNEQISFQYNPVPYDIDFDLHIFTKTQEEGLQIIEQIVPFFTPNYTLTANLLKDMPKCKFDLPVSLLGVTSQDTYEGSFEERRSIEWTLSFKMNGWLFGPTRTQGVILNSTVRALAVKELTPDEIQEEINNLVGQINVQTGETGSNVDDNIDIVAPDFENFHVIDRGSDFAFIVEVRDDGTDELYNLAGGNVRARFRKGLSDPDVKDIAADIQAIGEVLVSVPAVTTENIETGLYIFEVFFDTPEGGTIRLVQGTFLIR